MSTTMEKGILGPDQAEGLRRMMGTFANHDTKIIAITSGKGGVGKSSISLNLGIHLAKMKESPKKVIVMDADLGLANINVLMGIIPKYNLMHVIKGQKKISEIIYKTEYGLDIIAGANGFSQLANLKDEEKQNLIQAIREISYADYIIIDTSAGISSNVISFLLAAHEIIVVATPEPTSITDAYGVIKAIVSETDNANIKLLMNRVSSPAEANKVSQRIIQICGQFLNVKVESLGFVFEDPVVPVAVKKQIPFAFLAPNAPVNLCLNHIAKRLLNLQVSDEDKGWFKFLNAFFKRMPA
ncbi:Flagellar synthesis regulator FleN [Brevinematales bacterium NS]|nr:Flagellar synthesis regulator FleN [Brevinematales bacterium NS]